MTLQAQLMFWSALLALIAGFFLLFHDILLPFILGIAIAYFLNPIVNRLGHWKISRKIAALIILSSFFAILFGLMALITPIVYRELSALAEDIPTYVDQALEWLQPHYERVAQIISSESAQQDLKQILGKAIEPGMNIARALMNSLSSGGQAVGSFFTTLIFTPIVAYFMMIEWERICAWCEDLLPRKSKKDMMELLKEIDKKISGFVRGQIMVAFVLAIIYALALTFAGLKYGFLIGLLSGLLSIIPMVGSVVGFVVSVTLAFFQTSGDWSFVALIAGIFIAGQILEGNVLTPKFVGESVGMHPLWVFFALLAGGALMGITGMFLAVPVIAVTGVLIAYGIKKYKASPLYKEAEKKKTVAKKQSKKN